MKRFRPFKQTAKTDQNGPFDRALSSFSVIKILLIVEIRRRANGSKRIFYQNDGINSKNSSNEDSLKEIKTDNNSPLTQGSENP